MGVIHLINSIATLKKFHVPRGFNCLLPQYTTTYILIQTIPLT